MSFRARDALLAVPILGIPALAICVAMALPAAMTFLLAAASGVSLFFYLVLDLRGRWPGRG